MEHRWSVRKLVSGNVVVECPRLGLIPAVMRNISLGGMEVDADLSALPLNAPVAVVFDLPSGDRSDAYCLPAMVVRRTNSGVGIMFLEPEPDVIRSMRSALYGEEISGRIRVSAA